MRLILISENLLEELFKSSWFRLKRRSIELDGAGRWPVVTELFRETDLELRQLRQKIAEADVLRL